MVADPRNGAPAAARQGQDRTWESNMSKLLYAAILSTALIGAPALTQSTHAQSTPPATADASKTTAKPNKPPSPGQIAARERQKKCGEEWKAAKKAGKIEKGMKWPQYWSACNKRLKAGG